MSEAIRVIRLMPVAPNLLKPSDIVLKTRTETDRRKTVREIYPATRIQFTDGTDQTAFDLEISKDSEVNRFIISGRKGQTLSVSTTSADARIRLKKEMRSSKLLRNRSRKSLIMRQKTLLLPN